MPFMKGKAPIRRTMNYLNYGKLLLKNEIKVFSINYNLYGKHHEGARAFTFWYLPQIQFKNPDVQVVTVKNLTPSPFIRCFFENGKELIIDIDGKSKEDILEHCIKVIGKTAAQMREEELLAQKKDNPANFGAFCERPCICVIPGQVPCPGVIPLPDHMRGKFKFQPKD